MAVILSRLSGLALSVLVLLLRRSPSPPPRRLFFSPRPRPVAVARRGGSPCFLPVPRPQAEPVHLEHRRRVASRGVNPRALEIALVRDELAVETRGRVLARGRARVAQLAQRDVDPAEEHVFPARQPRDRLDAPRDVPRGKIPRRARSSRRPSRRRRRRRARRPRRREARGRRRRSSRRRRRGGTRRRSPSRGVSRAHRGAAPFLPLLGSAYTAPAPGTSPCATSVLCMGWYPSPTQRRIRT